MGTVILNPGLYIIDTSVSGVCSGADPDRIGDSSLAWKKSIKGFGPWIPVLLNAPEEMPHLHAWQAGGYIGAETVFILDACNSTMDVMRYMSAMGMAKAWDSVITVSQVSGRGQHGRKWVSPAGNLFASWLWPSLEPINGSDARWKNMTSLVAGGAVADFLEAAGIFVEVKWPNDLLCNGKKICGILVEDFGGSLITGIGINVNSAPDGDVLFRKGSIPAISLSAIGKTYAPLDLWLEIMMHIKAFYMHMTHHASPDFFLQWLDTRLAWKNQPIVIRELPDGEMKATLSGLAADGGLEIVRNGRVEVIYNGRIHPVG